MMRLSSIVLATVALLCASSGTAVAATGDFGPETRTGSATMVFGRIDGDVLLDGAEAVPTDPPDVAYVLQGAGGTFGAQQRAGAVLADDFADVALAIADPIDRLPEPVRRNDLVVGFTGAVNRITIFPQGARGFGTLAPIPVPGLAGATRNEFGRLERSATGSEAGDVTGDGRADAVFGLSDFEGDVGRWDRVVVVTSVGGSPRVVMSPELPFGATRSGLSLLDVTGDGAMDVVSGGPGVGYVTAAGGQVSGWTPFPVGLGGIGDVAVGRFNGDEVPDLVLVHGPDPDTAAFSLLLSRPDGSYEPAPLDAPAGLPCAVGTGDLDGDRRLDLVLRTCGRDEESREPAMTLLGDGRGSFSRLAVFRVLGGRRGASIIDLDGNGLGDLVFTGGSDSSTVVYMNQGVFDPCPGCRTQPGGGGTGTATVRSSSRAPSLGVALRARRWNPRRPLSFRIGCDERCKVTVSATVGFTRGARRRVLQAIPLRTRVLSLAADTSARVTLTLRPKSVLLARHLLRRGLVGRLAVTVRATDADGNSSGWRGVVALRR